MDIIIVNDSALNTNAEVIVNAANKHLLAGGGICGAIFSQAGKNELQAECDKIGYCAPGFAVITQGYNLKQKYIIHAVGPHYYNDPEPAEKLKSTYLSCLKLADEKQIKSIAFPCISTGIFRYPLHEATEIAIKTILGYKAKYIKTCYLYCYTQEEYEAYNKIYKQITTS